MTAPDGAAAPAANAVARALSWRTRLRMVRPGFLVVTAMACLLGLASAAACRCGFDGLKAIETVLLALVAHAAVNVLNDYHDALNGADAANTRGLFPFTGGARLIQNGEVSVNETQRFAMILLALLVPAGLWLTVQSAGGLIGIGLAGLLLGWAYSAPPLALMSRGLGELAVAAAWWLVVVGADYVQRGQFSTVPAATGVGYGLLVANILLINGFPDAPADERVGKRTLVVRLGPTAAASLYLGVVLLAHGWLAAAAWLRVVPPPTAWGLASFPVSLAAAMLLMRRANRPDALRPAIVASIGAAVVHGLAAAAGLMTTTWH